MKRLFQVIFICTVLSLSAFAQESKSGNYIFSYFKGNGEGGLHLAYSTDAYHWTALNNGESLLKPELSKDKLMRDPCIIRGGDGLFHMVWTVSWTDKGLGYASSKDLINWSEQVYVPVMEKFEGARNTWAPEITYDSKKKLYMIYWASTITGKFPETASTKESGYNHRMYYVTTKDFKTFSDTKILYEPGFNVIDASIVKDGKRFIMFLKDETIEPVEKNIKIAYGKNLIGPYSKATEPITGEFWAEGPTSVKVGDTWLVYFDKYRDHRYGAIASKDLKNWEDVSDKIIMPSGLRHGSILEITSQELEKLKALK